MVRRTRAVPPKRRQLLQVWIVSVGALSSLVAISIASRTGGDDPDQGRQRPGILDLGGLPAPAPRLPGVEVDGREAVVFFGGRDPAALCAALDDPPAELADAALVVVAEQPLPCPAPVVAVQLSPPRAAKAYGLPTPRDGGPPLGYAIIDDRGRIRYRTLDPELPSLLHEVATMLRAVR